MTEVIRQAQKHELPAILDLYRYLNADDPVQVDSRKITGIWEKISADPNHQYLVVLSGGKVVSSCVLFIIQNLTRNGSPYALIENVVTHPDYRRKGLGTRLLKYALEVAKEHGCYKVMLMSGRKEALMFYEQAGFERGSKTGFIVRFDGR